MSDSRPYRTYKDVFLGYTVRFVPGRGDAEQVPFLFPPRLTAVDAAKSYVALYSPRGTVESKSQQGVPNTEMTYTA